MVLTELGVEAVAVAVEELVEEGFHLAECRWLLVAVCLVGSWLESRGMPPLPFVVWHSWHYCRGGQRLRLADAGGGVGELAAADICRAARSAKQFKLRAVGSWEEMDEGLPVLLGHHILSERLWKEIWFRSVLAAAKHKRFVS